jgi:glycosyltransferase involved in cell wall biosynthesis
MTRLVIDARLAGHSGIGVYLQELLPRVLPQLASWRPLVLTRSALATDWTARFDGSIDVEAWDVSPLSVPDLFSAPPGLNARDLLWTPHFNVPLRRGVAQAVTLHDLLPLTLPDLAGRARAIPLRWWLRAIRQRARIVFCVSAFTRDEAIRHGAGEASRFEVTHLGVNREWFAPTPAPRNPSTPTMIFVGLMKPHKNVARMLRAFAQVRDRLPHRVVLVARHHGVRNVDQDAMRLVAQLGDRVELVEDIALPDLITRVRDADFALLCSLHEGFGLPALEAMAAGTPVLASRSGSLPEVCGDAALYCDPRSEHDIARGMLSLAGDAALRTRLAAAGRARAATFSWDACAGITASGLARVLHDLGASAR